MADAARSVLLGGFIVSECKSRWVLISRVQSNILHAVIYIISLITWWGDGKSGWLTGREWLTGEDSNLRGSGGRAIEVVKMTVIKLLDGEKWLGSTLHSLPATEAFAGSGEWALDERINHIIRKGIIFLPWQRMFKSTFLLSMSGREIISH